jgi:hypothetical protein
MQPWLQVFEEMVLILQEQALILLELLVVQKPLQIFQPKALNGRNFAFWR